MRFNRAAPAARRSAPLAALAVALGLAACKTGGNAQVKDDEVAAAPAAPVSPQSAQGKQEALWFQVRAQPYADLPPFHAPTPADAGLIADPEFNSRSFVQAEDVIPDGRRKVIHSFGAVATVAFTADPGVDHPYTGILKRGDAFGMARLSLAVAPVVRSPAILTNKFTPGMALKFFLDGPGHPSLNLVVMFKLDGQDSFNFFENTMSNMLPAGETPGSIGGAPLFAAGLARRGLSPHPTSLSVDHLGQFNPDGSKVAEPRAPKRLTFAPTAAAKAIMQNATAADDFRQLAARDVPAGTELYDVFASEDPTPFGPLGTHLGVVKTTSAFVASDFGDRMLHFQHFANAAPAATAAAEAGKTIIAAPAAVLDAVLPDTNAQGGKLPGVADSVATVLSGNHNGAGDPSLWNDADGRAFAKEIACKFSRINIRHSAAENARIHFCNGERTGFARAGQDACTQKCRKTTPVGRDCLQGCFDWMTSFCVGTDGC